MPSHHSGVAAVLAVDAVDLGRTRLLREVVVDRTLDALPVGVVDDHERRVRRDSGSIEPHAVELLLVLVRRCRSSRRRPCARRARRRAERLERIALDQRRRPARSARGSPRAARGCRRPATSCRARRTSPSLPSIARDEARAVVRADLDVASPRRGSARRRSGARGCSASRAPDGVEDLGEARACPRAAAGARRGSGRRPSRGSVVPTFSGAA